MEKEKIIQELQKHDSTILNFPDRGPWGSSSSPNVESGSCRRKEKIMSTTVIYEKIQKLKLEMILDGWDIE